MNDISYRGWTIQEPWYGHHRDGNWNCEFWLRGVTGSCYAHGRTKEEAIRNAKKRISESRA